MPSSHVIHIEIKTIFFPDWGNPVISAHAGRRVWDLLSVFDPTGKEVEGFKKQLYVLV